MESHNDAMKSVPARTAARARSEAGRTDAGFAVTDSCLLNRRIA